MKRIGLVYLMSSLVHGKSMKNMAESAKNEMFQVGVVLVSISLIWAGYHYIKGSQEGNEKLKNTVIFAILLFGGTSIIAVIKKVVGS